MRKVVTISLNGNAYSIEEDGYESLRAYLEEAQTKLREDPDRSEIVADLEQAIADKCNQTLRPHKSVVTAEEITRILGEMGPVDGESAEPPRAKSAAAAAASDRGGGGDAGPGPGAQKRLYQIREGAMISGVCSGLAAYSGLDVSVVRIIFVVLALLTWGTWILAYIVMMFVIPYASTSEERAAAHGMPFNAQQLVEQTKKHYQSFTSGAQWRKYKRREERARRRAWRRAGRPGSEDMKESVRPGPYWGPQWTPKPEGSGASYAARVVAGVMVPIVAIGNAILIVALIVAIAQFTTKGMIYGWTPPPGIPLWAGIVCLVIVYNVCAAPLHAARHAAFYTHSSTANAWFAVWGSVLWLGFVCLFFWLAYQYWPDLQHFIQEIADSIRNRAPHNTATPGGAASLLGFRSWRPD